jgi:hypothetical protein
MSKHNNANWDHYKLAGRERPGNAVPHEEERRRLSGAEAQARAVAGTAPHIPNQDRASSPRPDQADASEIQREQNPPSNAQAAADNDEHAPILSDDEGYTG